jgi:hypothetical protein
MRSDLTVYFLKNYGSVIFSEAERHEAPQGDGKRSMATTDERKAKKNLTGLRPTQPGDLERDRWLSTVITVHGNKASLGSLQKGMTVNVAHQGLTATRLDVP